LNAAQLEDYGKPGRFWKLTDISSILGNYLQRNLERWFKNYELSRTPGSPDLKELVGNLRSQITENVATIVHGDYR
jgi:aminoglycoside phosphotransferase (APT) family kinase protein